MYGWRENLEPIAVYSSTIKGWWDYVISDVQDLWGKEGKEGEDGVTERRRKEGRKGQNERIPLNIYPSPKSHRLVLIMSPKSCRRGWNINRRKQPTHAQDMVDMKLAPRPHVQKKVGLGNSKQNNRRVSGAFLPIILFVKQQEHSV